MIEALLLGAERTGRPRKTEFRTAFNAVRKLVDTGCEWRMILNGVRDADVLDRRYGAVFYSIRLVQFFRQTIAE